MRNVGFLDCSCFVTSDVLNVCELIEVLLVEGRAQRSITTDADSWSWIYGIFIFDCVIEFKEC